MNAKTSKKLLEASFWPDALRAETGYRRLHDDHDGTYQGWLGVYFDRMGDAYLSIDGSPALRFRTWGGGGMSERTRNALVLLAEAIRMDNEDRPQEVRAPVAGENEGQQ